MIHPLAEVYSNSIGKGTQVWQFAIILKDARIGENCNINCHTFIENEVVIGDEVTVKSGVFIWDGIEIKDKVFIGPNVTFTNDLYPRSKQRVPFLKTVLMTGCSIGANSTILAGISIGRFAMVGIGSVVTKKVPNYGVVYGNPARLKGYVDEYGEKLVKTENQIWQSSRMKFRKVTEGLIRIK